MKKLVLLALLLVPDLARAQVSCGTCEHICMWAPLITSAEKTRLLYADSDIVTSASEVPGTVAGGEKIRHLEFDVQGIMFTWATKSDAETPCYKIMYDEFLGGKDPGVIPDASSLNTVVSNLPKNGNLFHVAYDKKGCPIEDNDGKPFNREKELKKVCPALLDALYEHEVVHQNECLALWKKGGKKAAVAHFRDPRKFAASEVRGYDTQIRMMKESMAKLIERKGCNVSTYSIPDFAPKPTAEQLEQFRIKGLNVGEGLRQIHQNNTGVGK